MYRAVRISVPRRSAISVVTNDATETIEAMVPASDQPAVADQAARLPLTGVTAASEGGDHREVWNEQGEHHKGRQAAFVGEPEEGGKDDQNDADSRTFSDAGRSAAGHISTLSACLECWKAAS